MSAVEWIGTQVQVSPDLERGGWAATAYELDGTTVRRTFSAPSLAEVRDTLAEAGVFSPEQALQVEARVISILREMGYHEDELAELVMPLEPLEPLEPIKIEFDGQTYEVKVRTVRSPTGLAIEADLSELRRLLVELEA